MNVWILYFRRAIYLSLRGKDAVHDGYVLRSNIARDADYQYPTLKTLRARSVDVPGVPRLAALTGRARVGGRSAIALGVSKHLSVDECQRQGQRAGHHRRA